MLDLGLPDLDGGELLRMLRAVSKVPVIVATARDGDAEMVPVLDAGADDYVVKPFSAAQLDARIRAVLRRAGETRAGAARQVGGLRVDPRARRPTLDGAALELTPREFDVLHYLAARAGEVVTKRELLTEVWQLPVRRSGQDRGRAPVVAAQEAGRDRRGPPLPAHRRGRRGQAGRALVRRWLALLVAATTSLVLIALLVPMALLIRAVAENGAMNRATDRRRVGRGWRSAPPSWRSPWSGWRVP